MRFIHRGGLLAHSTHTWQRALVSSVMHFQGQEQRYHTLETNVARLQHTYTTHPWRFRFADDGALCGEYEGPSAEVEVSSSGTLSTRPWEPTPPAPPAEWGQYTKRGEALGVEVWCYDCVTQRAVQGEPWARAVAKVGACAQAHSACSLQRSVQDIELPACVAFSRRARDPAHAGGLAWGRAAAAGGGWSSGGHHWAATGGARGEAMRGRPRCAVGASAWAACRA